MKPRQMNLWRPLSAFIGAGGTEAELLEAYRAVKSDVGRTLGASDGQEVRAHQDSAKGWPVKGAAPVVTSTSTLRAEALEEVKRLVAKSVFDREVTHTGRAWGNVFYRELDSMTEDGEIARALRQHIGHLRGDDRNKNIRNLMTTREFAQLINKVRKNAA